MKKIFAIVMGISFIACGNKPFSQWSEPEIQKWFQASAWNHELTMKPDSSINVRLFVEQNVLNPTSWQAALKFLKETDFNSLELGRYELADDGTYANVEEYKTKDTAHFEAHRKYIDIQFLAKGNEYVYITPMEPDKQIETRAYNEQKDIEFFDKINYEKCLLTTKNFLVLFPTDGHKPCMEIESSEQVKKVVVKIPYKKY